MFKKRRQPPNMLVAITAGVSILIIGVFLPISYQKGWFNTVAPNKLSQVDTLQTDSQVLPLVRLLPQERVSELEKIATGKSLDSYRARYLLAADSIAQKRGAKALKWLENLEQDYKILAGYILFKRAEALELSGNRAEAETTWQELLNLYPKEPVAAEALYALGGKQTKYWDQALQQFPSHPRSIEIANRRLQQNPDRADQKDLMLLIAENGHYHPNIIPILDRLVKNFSSNLTEEEWEKIAFAYWEKQVYGKAGFAYSKAKNSPLHSYRAGRGLQLGDKTDLARIAYKKLNKEFPNTKESAQALLRLEKMVEPKEAMAYLEEIITRFPDKAPEAYLDKSKLYEELKNGKAALETREFLLKNYSKSDAAGELRWMLAKQRAAANDLQTAWEYGQQITRENPNTQFAPLAAFWVGKWAQSLGKDTEARKSFEYLLANYPDHYFAWRAAVFLGWDVGDFNSIRDKSPELVYPQLRPTLPAGSELLRELYNIGQDQDTWKLWQVEFKDRRKPSVAQQFTDGLMRLAVEDNLDGMYMINSLKNREEPEEKREYYTLRSTAAYWQALYPFPFFRSIMKWSKEYTIHPLLVTGLMRQESRFMPQIKSSVGAMGLMQLMPETGSEMAKNVGLKSYNLEVPEDNIQLGTAYLDYTHREYKNNSMLAVASYNAGPGNVSGWLNKYGLTDPDIFVEKIPFPETKNYVESVFANYWNYLRIYNPQTNKQLAEHINKFKATSP